MTQRPSCQVQALLQARLQALTLNWGPISLAYGPNLTSQRPTLPKSMQAAEKVGTLVLRSGTIGI
jgi:hypothetical protein